MGPMGLPRIVVGAATFDMMEYSVTVSFGSD